MTPSCYLSLGVRKKANEVRAGQAYIGSLAPPTGGASYRKVLIITTNKLKFRKLGQMRLSLLKYNEEIYSTLINELVNTNTTLYNHY